MAVGMQNSNALSSGQGPLRRFWSRARAAQQISPGAGVDPAQLDVGIRQIVELRVAQMASEVIGALTGTPLRSGPAFWR
jgi:hypothetical protein